MLRVVPHSGGASLLGLLLMAMTGCGAHHDETDSQSGGPEIRECSEYLKTYAHCLGRLSSLGDGDPRIAAMRARFVAPSGDAQREAQRSACITAQQQLSTACH